MIRAATPEDADAIWSVIAPVIRDGETCALPRDMSRDAALAYWMAADRETFVSERAGRIVGTYYIRPNQPGGGAHVCNCGYIADATSAEKGIGREMCGHSLAHAAARGFRAMQFNIVVSTNSRAVSLWKSLGFRVVGTVPGAFQSPHLGYVDALVMFREV